MTYALTKYAGGFKLFGTPGDEEIFTSHGDYTDLASLETVVDAEMAEATDDENTVAITGTITGIRTATDDFPLDADHDLYTGLNLGDGAYVPDMSETHQLERTRSLTVIEQPDGTVKKQVEWNSIAEEDSLRLARQLGLWTPGSLSGRSDAVSPVSLGGPQPFGEMTSGSANTFSTSSYLQAEVDPGDSQDPGHSQWQRADQDGVMYRVVWTLEEADPDDGVVFGVRRRGTDLTTIVEFMYTIPAGVIAPASDTDHPDGFYDNELLLKDEAVQIFIYSTGFYSSGFSADVKTTTLY